MKLILALAATVTLSGCMNGIASYNVKQFELSNGQLACCEVSIKNGKEIDDLEALIVKGADGSYSVSLREQGVKAFRGQEVAADVAAKATSATAAAVITPAVLPAVGTIIQGVMK